MPVIAARTCFWIVTVASAALPLASGRAEDALATIERLVTADPKPFVLVEATGDGSVGKGQGVMISPHGHVLSAGHVSWVQATQTYTDKFRVSLRGSGQGLPGGIVHTHKTIFKDHEDASFFEHFYAAKLLQHKESRFLGQGDLAMLQVQADGDFPHLEFWSTAKPQVKLGDTFHLCHYNSPTKTADPTFLINPVEVVGMARTPFGIQYLAKGYYRVGSSGGAILKDGRLIGIQSAAYTINAKDVGEIPWGLVSFQLVWSELFQDVLPATQAGHRKTETADEDEKLGGKVPAVDSSLATP